MILFAFLPEIAAFLLFIMMATQLPEIGPLLILAEFAIIAALFVLRTRAFLDVIFRWWWLLLMPALTMVSALWSEVPMISLRYGAQFFFTCFVGVLLARLLTPKRFVCTLMAAFFVFCVLCILHGRQGTSADGMVLIGLTGSKNQLGYAAQILMLSALAVLLMRNVAQPLRLLALASLPLAAYLLAGVNSATALLMAFGGSAVLIAAWWTQRLPPGGRLMTALALVLVLAPLTALTPEAIEMSNRFLFETLNKDPTLTGRTLLWERADHLFQQRPLLGYGFQAIWMGDSTETIALKRFAGIEDGRQFHFHHQFRQIAIDTGLVGLVTFCGAIIAALLSAVRHFLIRPDVARSFFLVMLALMVTRAFTDAIIGPFSVHTLIFFACCVYAFWRPEHAQATAQPARPPIRRRHTPRAA